MLPTEKRENGAWAAAYGSLGVEKKPRMAALPLKLLDPWRSAAGAPQPFRTYTPLQLEELSEDIRRHGVLVPIRVRPQNGRFEILAGHNRCKAAQLAGLTEIPALIEEADDDTAAEILVQTNLLQRQELLPSEKAYAYKLLMEARKRQGQRPDATSRQVVGKLDAAEEIGQGSGESGRQVQRHIRLTYLAKPLLDKVDEGSIGLIPGVELSYLPPLTQEMLLSIMERYKLKKISMDQAKALREWADRERSPTEDQIVDVLGLEAEKERKRPGLLLELPNLPPATLRKLTKDPEYLQGLQTAAEEYTARYLLHATPREDA